MIPEDLNTNKYLFVRKGGIMELKQISLTIPNSLLKASKSYSEELGYRNIQELILELLRNKVLAEKIERYKQIERDMKDAKKLSQKEAVNYIKNI
ncbi:MAG: ribbon-helix-helix domain-containing protein [Nanoarchaeota archaeon]|nr:ribbon-helix-helix domain-containing protein [Nanoarchaeota archaeon]